MPACKPAQRSQWSCYHFERVYPKIFDEAFRILRPQGTARCVHSEVVQSGIHPARVGRQIWRERHTLRKLLGDEVGLDSG